MSTKEKMQEIAQTISDKTKEYAPIVKEKLINGYNKSKDFTVDVIIPKTKEGIELAKAKIDEFQAKRAADKANKKPDNLDHK